MRLEKCTCIYSEENLERFEGVAQDVRCGINSIVGMDTIWTRPGISMDIYKYDYVRSVEKIYWLSTNTLSKIR